jgi:hypothetical protein
MIASAGSAVVKINQTINDVSVSGGREILKEAVIDENSLSV